MIRLKPAKPEVKVRDPLSMVFLPEGGLMVEMSSYWSRRLRDGDVIEVQDQPAPAAKVSKTNAGGEKK